MRRTWRLVSWNVHSCRGSDGLTDPARVAAVLEELGADAIGLQEVDGRSRGVDDRHQLDELAARLGLTPVAGPCFHDARGDYGNALLTRYPVEVVRRVELAHGRREPRGALDVVVRSTVEGASRPLRLIVTHLGLQRTERAAQARRLAEHVARFEEGTPTALLGDLNEWLGRSLPRTGLNPEPFPAGVAPRTFPSRAPLLALDRVLLRPAPVHLVGHAVATRAARTASDHLPVVVDVTWDAAALS